MAEDEKMILDKINAIIPEMSEKTKSYFVGLADGMALAKQNCKEQEQPDIVINNY